MLISFHVEGSGGEILGRDGSVVIANKNILYIFDLGNIRRFNAQASRGF
jgi:hypothetical protein